MQRSRPLGTMTLDQERTTMIYGCFSIWLSARPSTGISTHEDTTSVTKREGWVYYHAYGKVAYNHEAGYLQTVAQPRPGRRVYQITSPGNPQHGSYHFDNYREDTNLLHKYRNVPHDSLLCSRHANSCRILPLIVVVQPLLTW